jgi:hypothetical protein
LLISDVSVFEFFAESFTVMSVTVVDGTFTDGRVREIAYGFRGPSEKNVSPR